MKFIRITLPPSSSALLPKHAFSSARIHDPVAAVKMKLLCELPWERLNGTSDAFRYQVGLEVTKEYGLTSLEMSPTSECCGAPIAALFQDECSACRNPVTVEPLTSPLVRWNLGEVVECATDAHLYIWHDLATWDPLEAALFTSSVLAGVEALARELVDKLPPFELLERGLNKRFLVYPGSAKKRTLEDVVEDAVRAILARSA